MVETTSENTRGQISNSRPRRRLARRRNRRRNREPGPNEKSLVNFSVLHITVGVLAACLQMVHFTNNSILSQPQPGLWCGTFFIVTGAVCLSLSKIRGTYSTLVMLAFCLVSLFMALTLASLSWLGSEASLVCEETFATCNITTPHYYADPTEPATELEPKFVRKDQCDEDGDGKFSCSDLLGFCCGYNVGLGRTIHSLLMLAGVIEATTSFILAAVACSRSSGPSRRRYPSIIFAADDTEQPGTRASPVTAWDYPPPDKQNIFTVSIESRLPNEPPPPYETTEHEENSRF